MAISKGNSKIVYKENVSKKKVKFNLTKVNGYASEMKNFLNQISKCYDNIENEYKKALKNCGSGFLGTDTAMDTNADFGKKINEIVKKASSRSEWCKQRKELITKKINAERDAQFTALQKKYAVMEARVSKLEK